MKAKELMKELRKVDPNANVWIESGLFNHLRKIRCVVIPDKDGYVRHEKILNSYVGKDPKWSGIFIVEG